MYTTLKEEEKKNLVQLSKEVPWAALRNTPNAKTAFLEEVLQLSRFPLHWG